MRRYMLAVGGISLMNSLWSTDYSFLNEERFVQQKFTCHLEGDYSVVGAAKITSDPAYGSHMNYAEGTGSIWFSHFLNQENAITWQLGTNTIDINWKDNPAFHKSFYLYGVSSLSWISQAIDQWRWVLNGGVTFDLLSSGGFGRSAVYFTTLWGRYAHTDSLGLHIGFFGYYGAKNGYVLPILGLDYAITPKWEIKAVFPIDVSLNYKINSYFTSSILATSMGGPYRIPRRMRDGIGEYERGIFKIYSTAAEWNLKYHIQDRFLLGAGGGWNFGGWLQVSHHDNSHKKYYNFQGAPYGRLFASITF